MGTRRSPSTSPGGEKAAANRGRSRPRPRRSPTSLPPPCSSRRGPSWRRAASPTSPSAPAPSTRWLRWRRGHRSVVRRGRRLVPRRGHGRPFYGDKPGVEERLRRADAATQRFVATGEVLTVPVHSSGDDRAGMCIDMDYYADPARGAVPSWPNTMAEMSWRHWLTFDGLPAADRVTTLVIFVHLDGCVFPDTVRDVAASRPRPCRGGVGRRHTDRLLRPAGPGPLRCPSRRPPPHCQYGPGEEEPPPETASTCSGPMRVDRHVKG